MNELRAEDSPLKGRVQFRDSSTPDGVPSRGAGWHALRRRRPEDLSDGDMLKFSATGGAAHSFGVIVVSRFVPLPDLWSLVRKQHGALTGPSTPAPLWDRAWNGTDRPSLLMQTAILLGVAPRGVIAAAHQAVAYVSRLSVVHARSVRYLLRLSARTVLDRRPPSASIPEELPSAARRVRELRGTLVFDPARRWLDNDIMGSVLALYDLITAITVIEKADAVGLLHHRLHDIARYGPSSIVLLPTSESMASRSRAAMVRACVPLSSVCMAAAEL